MKVIYNSKDLKDIDVSKKIYTCSNCGKLFNWNNQSSWYGNLNDLDNSEIKIFSCSDKCQTK